MSGLICNSLGAEKIMLMLSYKVNNNDNERTVLPLFKSPENNIVLLSIPPLSSKLLSKV